MHRRLYLALCLAGSFALASTGAEAATKKAVRKQETGKSTARTPVKKRTARSTASVRKRTKKALTSTSKTLRRRTPAARTATKSTKGKKVALSAKKTSRVRSVNTSKMSPSQLVSHLFGKGKKLNDWIPVYPEGHQDRDSVYLSWYPEAEAKLFVGGGHKGAKVGMIERHLGGGDLRAIFGDEVGAQLEAEGFTVEKQVKDRKTRRFRDIYEDTADGAAAKKKLTIRHRQIDQQIDTEEGTYTVKMYTKGKPGPVADRLEIRFRTNARMPKSKMSMRSKRTIEDGSYDAALDAHNPIAYLAKVDSAFEDGVTAQVEISDQRNEFLLKDKNGTAKYLVTLDRVTGNNLARQTGEKGSTQFTELEMEQVEADESPQAMTRLRQLSGAMQQNFRLQASTGTKYSMAAQRMGKFGLK